MTVGVPGCGKSTWARNHQRKNPGTLILSTDSLRKTMWGSKRAFWEQDAERLEEARGLVKRLYVTSIQIVLCGLNKLFDTLILDNTHVDVRDRNDYTLQSLYEMKENHDIKPTLWVFHTELDDLITRNSFTRNVDDQVPIEHVKHCYKEMYKEHSWWSQYEGEVYERSKDTDWVRRT